jgi:hypothetical protein
MQAKAHRLVECQRFDAHARSEIYKGSILVFRQSKALGKLVEITEKMRAKSEGEDKYKGKPQQQLPSDLYLSSPHSLIWDCIDPAARKAFCQEYEKDLAVAELFRGGLATKCTSLF